jgi:glycosyltransferase involved in cell wall biosynthesis
MTAPGVSVVMSVYNGGEYLREAVDSILNQTFTDFEFIILDDASTDGTWQIVTTYAQQDPRVTPIRNEENMGLTRSLNKGFTSPVWMPTILVCQNAWPGKSTS